MLALVLASALTLSQTWEAADVEGFDFVHAVTGETAALMHARFLRAADGKWIRPSADGSIEIGFDSRCDGPSSCRLQVGDWEHLGALPTGTAEGDASYSVVGRLICRTKGEETSCRLSR